MVRLLSVFLPLALAATAVNAQFGDFIKNALGGVIAQNPLASGIPNALVAKKSQDITSENWRSAISVTADPGAPEGDAKEWLFYFTTKNSNATSTRNVTYWDGVYNETVYALSTTRPASKLNFGKIDCSTAPAQELCNAFYLTAPYKLPVFYHIATYFNNNTSEIRPVPLYINNTEHATTLAKFHTEKKWKDVSPWAGKFNPIDGLFKDYSSVFAPTLRMYEMIPQWVLMLGISLLGRGITTRFTNRALGPDPAQRRGAPPA
ncbi:hypothetical protein FN846DRAFT_121917 [Sphaerosporella brunnea]|uniref:Uncharacterized protein n=1 Tax=Sphaerosporella brunnea TaxID=1250544 RepID=A0A5J5ES80_9PEZI|nr:hypothetical protein FN846DRAFT_121917 [Sphaerosporella brunnea]